MPQRRKLLFFNAFHSTIRRAVAVTSCEISSRIARIAQTDHFLESVFDARWRQSVPFTSGGVHPQDRSDLTGFAVKKGTLRKGSHLVWNSITYTAVLTVTEVSAVLVFPERNSAWTVRVVRRTLVKPAELGRPISRTRHIPPIRSAFSSQALTPSQSIPKRRVASGQPAMLRVCLRKNSFFT